MVGERVGGRRRGANHYPEFWVLQNDAVGCGRRLCCCCCTTIIIARGKHLRDLFIFITRVFFTLFSTFARRWRCLSFLCVNSFFRRQNVPRWCENDDDVRWGLPIPVGIAVKGLRVWQLHCCPVLVNDKLQAGLRGSVCTAIRADWWLRHLPFWRTAVCASQCDSLFFLLFIHKNGEPECVECVSTTAHTVKKKQSRSGAKINQIGISFWFFVVCVYGWLMTVFSSQMDRLFCWFPLDWLAYDPVLS